MQPPSGTLAFTDALPSGSGERGQGHVRGAAVLEGVALSWLALYHCTHLNGMCGAAVLEGVSWHFCLAEGQNCDGCWAALCDGWTADALTPAVSTAAAQRCPAASRGQVPCVPLITGWLLPGCPASLQGANVAEDVRNEYNWRVRHA